MSILHAVIPSHWLPVLAIGKKDNWSLREVMRVTFVSGLAHASSTLAIGIVLGFAGLELSNEIQYFSQWIAPLILVAIGIFFIYQHHRHKHFHLHQAPGASLPKAKIIMALVIGMFFSPCLEIEAYFLMAGTKGWWAVLTVGSLYLLISVTGMVILVRLAYKEVLKLNWHSLEHNAGIITGWTLIVTGIISFFIS